MEGDAQAHVDLWAALGNRYATSLDIVRTAALHPQGIFDSKPLALVPGPLWHTKFNNFGPRLGAAYQVTPKTVLRRTQ